MGHSVSNDFEKRGEQWTYQMENGQTKYKVGFPPRRNFIGEFNERFNETFFADDPLRPYKDKPLSRKLLLCLQFFFPILDWARHYDLRKFKGDLIAGLTIASLCIPQVQLINLYQIKKKEKFLLFIFFSFHLVFLF